MKKKVNKGKQKKEALKIKKKLSTTLDWLDIQKIDEDMVLLKHSSKEAYVKGIKLTPKNIFMEKEQVIERTVNSLRIALNKLNIQLWHSFVLSPIDLEFYFSDLLQLEKDSDNPKKIKLIQDDFHKASMFLDEFREVEFFIFCRANDLTGLNKIFPSLLGEFNAAGFYPKQLVKVDYENYFDYLFENPMINDFYFSKGLFSILREKKGEVDE